ncbi:hypothetical protein FM036_20565 [Nostoc sp. HG1]|nr:hypothetical protein [Nostoc sp. HG1]MCL6754072.1 hypothetical protein [Nostoc sp. CCCryo 231-06]
MKIRNLYFYGFIFIFQGWRLDPILQLCQLVLVIFTIFYTIESIRIRRINGLLGFTSFNPTYDYP